MVGFTLYAVGGSLLLFFFLLSYVFTNTAAAAAGVASAVILRVNRQKTAVKYGNSKSHTTTAAFQKYLMTTAFCISESLWKPV